VYAGFLDQLTGPPWQQWLDNNSARALTSQGVGSIDDIVNDTTGPKMFDDRNNNMVWFKIKGGLNVHAATELNAYYRAMSWLVLR
jgi:hypothetical protein